MLCVGEEVRRNWKEVDKRREREAKTPGGDLDDKDGDDGGDDGGGPGEGGWGVKTPGYH